MEDSLFEPLVDIDFHGNTMSLSPQLYAIQQKLEWASKNNEIVVFMFDFDLKE